MTATLQQRLAFAKNLAKEAGTMALSFQEQLQQGQLDVTRKGLQDFVSEADRETERFIRQSLLKHFPDDGYLGEETGSTKGQDGQWVVDPIDGTTNFLREHSLWCVSIAYLVDGEPVLGVIYDPNSGELFSARANGGAYLNDNRQLTCSDTEQVKLVNLGYSSRSGLTAYFQRIERLLAHDIEHRRHGSAALGLAHVAAGRFDGYHEESLNAWDIMAGVAILREAGFAVILQEREGSFSICTGTASVIPLLQDV